MLMQTEFCKALWQKLEVRW